MAVDYDLLVVGGGINGAGIANQAAQSGLKVLLVEQADLASATSSASSKLIHGGLRYLEYREFRLVRESLTEREVLLGMAPHLIWPLTFVLPHESGVRPAWMIRIGLFLYDHLGGRKRLPSSRGITLHNHAYGEPLKSDFKRGFTYADCWVDDARLVVANALQLADLGGKVLTRTCLQSAIREEDHWLASLQGPTGEQQITARAIVNAAGPWVEDVLRQRLGQSTRDSVRMVKGSHIVVPRLHAGPQAYILQNADRRVIFVLPYESDFSLIGTTDIGWDGDPAEVSCTDAEVEYLCSALAEYFRDPPTPDDVVWRYSGVRPLYDDQSDDPSAVTRDYVLRMDAEGAPLLSVFGGKLTTYRQLALHAMREIGPLLGASAPTGESPPALPGGEIADADFDAFLQTSAQRWSWLDTRLLCRLCHQYGSRVDQVLAKAKSVSALGQDFGAGLYEREVRYLVEHEWASHADDVLWRRTKRGLHMGEHERRQFTEWFDLTFRVSA